MPTSSNKPYRKLPGSGGSAFQRHRLWLGSDHILSVASSSIGERYRRFYFADIQAFVWRRTAAIWVRTAVWVTLVALCGLGLLSPDQEVRLVFGGIAVFFLVFIAIDFAFGRTCACFVKTAVQFERLPSLGRERTLLKVLGQLNPLVEAAQTPGVKPIEESAVL